MAILLSQMAQSMAARCSFLNVSKGNQNGFQNIMLLSIFESLGFVWGMMTEQGLEANGCWEVQFLPMAFWSVVVATVCSTKLVPPEGLSLLSCVCVCPIVAS